MCAVSGHLVSEIFQSEEGNDVLRLLVSAVLLVCLSKYVSVVFRSGCERICVCVSVNVMRVRGVSVLSLLSKAYIYVTNERHDLTLSRLRPLYGTLISARFSNMKILAQSRMEFD